MVAARSRRVMKVSCRIPRCCVFPNSLLLHSRPLCSPSAQSPCRTVPACHSCSRVCPPHTDILRPDYRTEAQQRILLQFTTIGKRKIHALPPQCPTLNRPAHLRPAPLLPGVASSVCAPACATKSRKRRIVMCFMSVTLENACHHTVTNIYHLAVSCKATSHNNPDSLGTPPRIDPSSSAAVSTRLHRASPGASRRCRRSEHRNNLINSLLIDFSSSTASYP